MSFHYNGHYLRKEGFEARIAIDYFQIAREYECKWDDPWNG